MLRHHFLIHFLWLLLAITNGSQAVGSDTMFDEVVHHAFSTPLRQSLVVGSRTFVVAVGRKFDGDIGVLVQQIHQFVECLCGFRTQGSLVEIVENVVDEYGCRD